MLDGLIPTSYDEWYHCITVECGLSLTSSFIKERILAMQNTDDFRTQQFVEIYGSEYHQQVLNWFQQAQEKR